MKISSRPHKLFSLIVFIAFNASLFAQNFDYSFSKTSSTYADLTNASVLGTAQDWSEQKFKIAIGFNFNVGGYTFDSITISPNGFINFGSEKKISLIAFNGFGSARDTLGNYISSLSYSVTGNTGSKILKIEYKNLGMQLGLAGNLNYQVWFYENNGDVELHIGQNDFSVLEDSIATCSIGLLNPYMDASQNSFLVYGNPDSAQTQIIQEGGEQMKSIIRIPSANTVLRFRKNF